MEKLWDNISIISIGIAVVTGWVRIKRINPAFYPFIACITIGLVNECVSLYLIEMHRHSIVNMNINLLCEALLCCWLFERWGLFNNNKKLFYGIQLSLVAGWITENFIFSNIHYFSSYFYITYSFMLVLFSISQVNLLITRERKNILKNSVFLICVTFIAYYTVAIIVEAFILYGLNEGLDFMSAIFNIFLIINIIANINFTLAILWIPTKQKFTLPS